MSERLTDEQLRAVARFFTEQSIEAAAVNEAIALRARVAKLEAALEKAQFALLYGDKQEFSEALDAIDAALKDKP